MYMLTDGGPVPITTLNQLRALIWVWKHKPAYRFNRVGGFYQMVVSAPPWTITRDVAKILIQRKLVRRDYVPGQDWGVLVVTPNGLKVLAFYRTLLTEDQPWPQQP